MTQPSDMQQFSAEGQVVELLDEGSQRTVKVLLSAPIVLDTTESGDEDLRLGDRVVVHGCLALEKEVL